MVELGTKRRVRLPAEPPPAPRAGRRRSPFWLGGLALWALAVAVGALVTTSPARRADWWAWGVARGAAVLRRAARGWGRPSAPGSSAPAAASGAPATQRGPATASRAAGRRSPLPVASGSYPDVAAGSGVAGDGAGPSPAASGSGGASRPELPTCEAALRAHRDLAMAEGDAGLRVTIDAHRAALAQGSYLLDCEGAYDAAVSICVAVRDGHVVGVTARAEPPQPEIERCLRRVVAALKLEPELGFDVTEVSFPGR